MSLMKILFFDCLLVVMLIRDESVMTIDVVTLICKINMREEGTLLIKTNLFIYRWRLASFLRKKAEAVVERHRQIRDTYFNLESSFPRKSIDSSFASLERHPFFFFYFLHHFLCTWPSDRSLVVMVFIYKNWNALLYERVFLFLSSFFFFFRNLISKRVRLPFLCFRSFFFLIRGV